MIKRYTVLMAVAAVCLLAACSAAEPVYNPELSPAVQIEATPIPTAGPTPTATPKPESQVVAELEAALEQSIRDAIQIDITGLLPEGEGGERLIITLDNQSESGWMLNIRDEVVAAIENGVAQAEGHCSAEQPLTFSNQLIMPGWQFLYTLLLYRWEDAAAYSECIKENLTVQVNVESAGGQMQAAVSVEPVYYRDAIRTVTGDDDEMYFETELVYAYMNTIFDENIEEKEYILPLAEGNLADGIVWPLQRYTRLRKSWFASRDNGARKHSGTDIWAPEGTEIYSCTDGTVFYVGTTQKGGNVVVILDQYGYMFEYCHMVSQSDFLQPGQQVEARQLIGYVGNTGNSARNHLHITIVNTEGIIINPYSYLRAARPH